MGAVMPGDGMGVHPIDAPSTKEAFVMAQNCKYDFDRSGGSDNLVANKCVT
jgi:hypothetical protein